jgi:cytochrome c553
MKLAIPLILALASLFTNAHAQDVQAGATKVAMCIGCHGIVGYQASFPEIHKVPKISGQSARYIETSLAAYRNGDRKHPSMRAVAQSLTDQDIADIAAFYAAQGKQVAAAEPKTPPEDTAALLAKGACASCHGANYNQPIDPSYPKIAGQHADYLYVALKAYKVDRPVVGRNNAIMVGQVKQFSNAELKAMAAYLASLPSELDTRAQSKFR